MAKRRRFTPKFKSEVVLEALTGESSQAELCRRYNLSENQVSTWKRQRLENVETFFESADKPSSESAARIAELEQRVAQLTLALEIQKKALTLLDGHRLHSDAELRRCARRIRCERFARRWVSTRAPSIINHRPV